MRNEEALLEAWHKVMGENAIIRTDERWDNTVKHLGYQPVSINWDMEETLSKVIPTDVDIKRLSQEKLRMTEVIPDERIETAQKAHLELARAIVRDIFPYSPPSGVFAAIIPPASDRVRTAGMYGTTTQTIYIALDMLFRGKPTVDTLIHEMAHHRQWRRTGEAEDLTKSHAEAMTQIAAQVIDDLAHGRYDRWLDKVVW